MRFLRHAILGLAACVTSVVVACSGSSPSSGGELGAATTGPLRGTYAADSDDGDSPFASITFLENDRFEAIENDCYADTTPGGCVHTGSYAVDGDSVVLDDDGGGKTTIPLGDAQVTTVADTSGTSGDGGNGLLAAEKPDDLFVVTGDDAGDAGDGGDASDAASVTTGTTGSSGSGGGVVITVNIDAGGGSLVSGSGGLLGNGQVVVSFPLGGTPMVQAGSPSTTSPSSGTPLVSSPGSTTTPSTSSPSSSTTPSSSPSSSSTPGSTPAATGSLVNNNAVTTALTWVTAQVPYCGGVNNGPDAICGGICRRTGAANNPQWNAYRSDCSGLVSYAWGLAAPGLTTKQMAPLSASQSTAIPVTSLQPGDALNSGHHVVLFQKWVNQSAGSATIIEESDCHLVAMTKNVTLKVGASPSVQMGSSTYTAIRAKGGTLVNSGH